MSCAADSGHDEVIKLLINAKADIDHEDKKENVPTPLHLAAEKGHCNAVDVLLRNNANVSAVNEKQENPLDVAIEKGHK